MTEFISLIMGLGIFGYLIKIEHRISKIEVSCKFCKEVERLKNGN